MRLDAHDVAVTLAGRKVLGPVTLSLAPGEVVGLLGPNGAGKSTLMRALAGLVGCTGAIRGDGADLVAMAERERARRVAYLPQARIIGWPLVVRDIVLLGRMPWRPYGTRPSDADVAICDEAMRLMDVAHLAGRPATELSGGEQARVLAARAVAQDTPLLIADEPAAGLDPAHQIAMMAAFRILAGRRRTVLVSLHDLTLAARWCDRVIVLDRGQIAAEGAPGGVLGAALLRDVYGITAHVAHDDQGLILAPLALSAAAAGGAE
ncbi:MAG: ABC transporter ATP-binding protein [Mesorhizobium sp.]|nr:ABC transporter ATP-binding protein [Mesorhizobium sp.]